MPGNDVWHSCWPASSRVAATHLVPASRETNTLPELMPAATVEPSPEAARLIHAYALPAVLQVEPLFVEM